MEAILAKAAKTNSREDYDALFSAACGIEFFFNVTRSEFANDDGLVSTPLVNAGRGLNAVLLFTSQDNRHLKQPFGGLVWERALKMVANMPQADGLIIQNNDATWVAIDKEQIKLLLAVVA